MKYNFARFTDEANIALNSAIECAQELGHTYIGSEHLLLGIAKTDCAANEILSDFDVTFEELSNQIAEKIGRGNKTALTTEHLTPRANNIIENAVRIARHQGAQKAGSAHLLFALISEYENYAIKFLANMGVDIEELQQKTVEALNVNDNQPEAGGFAAHEGKKNKGNSLEKFGTDLTQKASEGKLDPVIARDNEIKRVVEILCRRKKNNPCLIGEAGVGKTAIAEGLAQLIADKKAPEFLQNKKIISLDLTGMVAGTKYRGDFEERIKKIIETACKDENVILFIDEIHTLIGAGSAEGSTDAANILKPYLARGEMQVIGATTIEEYRKYIEKDAALERRFQPVNVGEPTVEDAITILKGLKSRYEKHHSVQITDEAVEAAVKLSSRYIFDRFLPDKAIDILDEAAAKVRLRLSEPTPEITAKEKEIKELEKEKTGCISSQNFEKAAEIRDNIEKLNDELKKLKAENNTKDRIVTKEDVAAVVSEWSQIPVSQLTKEEKERLLHLEDELHKSIIGQDEAVTALSKAIRRGRTGIKDENRPIGSFIFLGPTGVGKTELCKALAQAMFGSKNAMIRLDMSEYMEKHTVSKMIGSPPGYVGFEEGGQLTERIRRKPYSVVLFDEIEKAHPDVFNILLQILEDGHITDSNGRKVDFKNTVIIMTSNVGARYITDNKVSFGFSGGEQAGDEKSMKDLVIGALKEEFKPEFLNRVDDIIVFSKLSFDEIKKISHLMLNSLNERLSKLNIKAEFEDSLIEEISKAGYDQSYGARPLRRAITSNIEDAISEKILSGEITNGDTVKCSFEDGKYTFKV